jgi:membrane fusion protein (multidrug efflux system)
MNATPSDQSKTVPPSRMQSRPEPQTDAGDQPIDDVPMFRRKRVIFPSAIVIVLVIAAAWFWYMQRYTYIATDDASIEANRATVSARILGRIAALRVDEGDTVHQGDTLVLLDDADLRAQLQKAEASLRYITRNVEIQSVNRAKAIDDYSRIEKQFQSHIVSQEQYSHAESARKLAEAQSDMASAQILTAQADLAIVKTQLSNTVITAPFSGIVAKRWALAGDVVSPGQAVFSMFDNKHVWVTANFEETKLRVIRSGSRARISVDAFPGVAVEGKVESIGRSTASQFSLIPANNASGNFTKITQRVPVKISIDSAPGSVALLPGLSANVRIVIK